MSQPTPPEKTTKSGIFETVVLGAMRDCLGKGFFIIAVLATILLGFFITYGLLTNQLDEMFCEINPFCETDKAETKIVDEQIIWEKFTERTVLDLGKYERNGEWRATRNTLIATWSKNMRGTVNITMGMNLALVDQENITIDRTERIITIALPPVQPVDCFITEQDFFGGACIDVCDDLERDLEKKAIEGTLDSEAFDAAMDGAVIEAKSTIAEFIDIGNISNEPYTLRFTEQAGSPPAIPAATCPQ